MADARARFLPVLYLPFCSGHVGWVAGVGDRTGEFCRSVCILEHKMELSL